MIKQSTSLSFPAEVSLQSPSEQLRPCQELLEDGDSIDTVPEHVANLDAFKNQGTGQSLP
jgi:hypothetical protein